jgi:hypothetical protein
LSIRWRTQVYSVRKSVEDFFGVLKARFRILKLPIEVHSKKKIDDIFFTCVTLHNILHSFDGKDNWDAVNFEWNEDDSQFVDDADDAQYWGRPKVRRKNNEWEFARSAEDHSSVGSFFFGEDQVPVVGSPSVPISPERLVEIHTETGAGFRVLVAKLVKNYVLRYAQRSVVWLRSRSRRGGIDE